jgi:hypothetical protein
MNAVPVEVAAPLKIDKKIVAWSVKTDTDEAGNTHTVREAITLERPRVVEGRTYKISPAVTDSAMYITINDAVMDDGTRRPLEMFINTKHVAHQQWITALTRMVSAIFRKPGPYLFVADELQQIFDPQGGYFDGGKMMPSVVAHVAEVLREHFIWIGAMEAPELSLVQKEVIAEKVAQAEKAGITGGQICTKCHESSVIMLDGCMTCTSCGDSKCG